MDRYAGIPLSMLLAWFFRQKPGQGLPSPEFRRILVVKLAALGDAVLLVPSLRALRKRYPRAEIVFLGTSLTESFLRQFPEYIDRFVVITIRSFLRPGYVLRFIRDVRSLACDAAIDFEQWTRFVPLILALARIPVRVGFRVKRQFRHFLYTHCKDRNPRVHEVDNFLSLAEVLGAADHSRALEVKTDPAFVKDAEHELTTSGWDGKTALIVLHPGCGEHGFPREWPPSSYSEFASRISKNFKAFFVVSGTEQEVALLDQVRMEIGSSSTTFKISDPCRFVGMLSLASLFVSGNNGAMHLAAALRVPQVALHGPTNPGQWGPLNLNATVVRSHCPLCPCLDLGSEYHRRDGYCMSQIPVAEVYQASLEILEAKTGR